MEEKDIVAQNLSYYRKQAGLSQLELADKLKYSNKNISKWENGETTPNVFTLKKLAELYNVTIDDLVNKHNPLDEQLAQQNYKQRQKRKRLFQYGMLLLANAILFSVACIIILALSLSGVTCFNKWLLLLFIQPLDCLSVFIFIRCIYKRIDPVSLSLFGWFIVLSLYLSLLYIAQIEMIFIIGAAYQFLVICLTLIINLKLIDEFAKSFKQLKEKRKIKNSK